jgi:hypothetical protein
MAMVFGTVEALGGRIRKGIFRRRGGHFRGLMALSVANSRRSSAEAPQKRDILVRGLAAVVQRESLPWQPSPALSSIQRPPSALPFWLRP